MTEEEKKKNRKEKRKKFWGKLKNGVSRVAPLLGGVLGGPLGGAMGDIIADSLGVDRDDEESLVRMVNDPAMASRLLEIQENNKLELEKMRIQQVIEERKAETAETIAVNETMRHELDTDSAFRASWRPTFGYIMAFSFGGLIFSAVWSIIKLANNVTEVLQGITGLTPLLTIGLAVLGVNIRDRTKEKLHKAGQVDNSTGFLGLWKK